MRTSPCSIRSDASSRPFSLSSRMTLFKDTEFGGVEYMCISTQLGALLEVGEILDDQCIK